VYLLLQGNKMQQMKFKLESLDQKKFFFLLSVSVVLEVFRQQSINLQMKRLSRQK
jgi:hypothetical protein